MRRFTAFKDSLACRYGLREAIFLRKLFLWVRRGKADGSCYERNGILWVRMTLAQMQGEIPYFSRHDTEDLLRKVQSYRELARVRHVGKKRAQEILVAMEAKGFYVEHLKKG